MSSHPAVEAVNLHTAPTINKAQTNHVRSVRGHEFDPGNSQAHPDDTVTVTPAPTDQQLSPRVTSAATSCLTVAFLH